MEFYGNLINYVGLAGIGYLLLIHIMLILNLFKKEAEFYRWSLVVCALMISAPLLMRAFLSATALMGIALFMVGGGLVWWWQKGRWS